MSRRRQNGKDYSLQLDAQAWKAKNRYFKAICSQKKKHWEEFLEDNDNIWQASKYLSDSNTNPAFVPIPGLVTREDEFVTKNHEIAAKLLAKFFPPLPKYPTLTVEDRSNQLNTLPITEEEIQNAIFQASPLKGAGHDRIPALVWQKTWPILKDFVVPLFQSSLQRGKLPDTWKIAKIQPLRKPNKGN